MAKYCMTVQITQLCVKNEEEEQLHSHKSNFTQQ